MADKPKGGYATAIIVFVMLGMIFFYVLMVYPSERQKLLRGENQMNNVPQPNLIFKDTNTYYVGNGAPEVVFNYSIGNFYIGYPLKSVLIKSDNVTMSANVIKPQIRAYSLIWGNGSWYYVKLDVKSDNGVIYVISGTDVIKEIRSPGLYEFKVPGTFSLKFSHGGFDFWNIKHTNFEISIYKKYYDPSKSDVKINIPINDIYGEYVGIKFNAEGSGNVKVLLNGHQVFNGSFMNETDIIVPRDKAGINTMNSIELISSKGSEYNISNVVFYLFSGPSPTLSKVYYINPINSNVKVGVKLEVLKPGILSFAIMPKGTIFFIPRNKVHNGWNYINLNDTFVENAHGIKVFSVDGKFKIDEFVIQKV